MMVRSPILHGALASSNVDSLAAFVAPHHNLIRDPYEGEALPSDWRSLLDVGDVRQFADFALTLYYSPAADQGVGDAWSSLSDRPSVSTALLGSPFGPPENLFDPGRIGSYFQTLDAAHSSLATLQSIACPELAPYISLLRHCSSNDLGVYITF